MMLESTADCKKRAGNGLTIKKAVLDHRSERGFLNKV